MIILPPGHHPALSNNLNLLCSYWDLPGEQCWISWHAQDLHLPCSIPGFPKLSPFVPVPLLKLLYSDIDILESRSLGRSELILLALQKPSWRQLRTIAATNVIILNLVLILLDVVFDVKIPSILSRVRRSFQCFGELVIISQVFPRILQIVTLFIIVLKTVFD